MQKKPFDGDARAGVGDNIAALTPPGPGAGSWSAGSSRDRQADVDHATLRSSPAGASAPGASLGNRCAPMVEAARGVIRVGVREYQLSLAALAAGTERAAKFLDEEASDPFASRMIHNLQIMQSGHHTCMVHRRPTTRRILYGDPIYLCFCGITTFKGYWLGFDREYFLGTVTSEQARLYEVTVNAQAAALNAIRPGAIAEDVHFAANEVYLKAGFPATYRTGRGTGASILEAPELKAGDKTKLQPGMTFAVDGGLTVSGRFGARVGDSIVVTADGFEYLTPYPKDLTVI